MVLCLLVADEVDILGYGSSEEDQGSSSALSVDSGAVCADATARQLQLTDDVAVDEDL